MVTQTREAFGLSGVRLLVDGEPIGRGVWPVISEMVCEDMDQFSPSARGPSVRTGK